MQAGVSLGPMHRQRAMTQLSGMARSVSPVARAPHSMVTRLSGMARSVSPMARGVDLNLDEFDLSTHTRVAPEVSVGSWGSEAAANISKAFWSSISENDGPVFKDEDKNLLKKVFNEKLSDRREDGDKFVPPETSFTYVQRLRNLVEEEAAVQQERKAHFCSKSFVIGDAGALFPASWTSSFEVARGLNQDAMQGSLLHPRPEYVAQASLLKGVLRSAVPVFNETTEDGNRFRIYKFGSLEVRTTQEVGGDEVVGAAFSMQLPKMAGTQGEEGVTVDECETVTKVTEFVESTQQRADSAKHKVPKSRRHAYVVLETESGNVVVTEMCRDGQLMWQENPAGWELRNSLSKVIHCADCKNDDVRVADLKSIYNQQKRTCVSRASYSRCKKYAHDVFTIAKGEVTDKSSAQQVWGTAWWYKGIANKIGAQAKTACSRQPSQKKVSDEDSLMKWQTNKNKIQALRTQITAQVV